MSSGTAAGTDVLAEQFGNSCVLRVPYGGKIVQSIHIGVVTMVMRGIVVA